jgi:hypothetical protein
MIMLKARIALITQKITWLALRLLRLRRRLLKVVLPPKGLTRLYHTWHRIEKLACSFVQLATCGMASYLHCHYNCCGVQLTGKS